MSDAGKDGAVAPYAALALQMRCHAVNDCATADQARARIRASIERCDRQIRGSMGFIKTYSGDVTRLVVLPEYFLTGYPRGENPAQWRAKACLHPDGAEYELLGECARANGVYLSGNAYETDDHFPDLHFQCSFIIDPSGKLILRYRRQISMFAPTPHDVLARYLEVYGADALYPVAETAIGRLACVASEEILYPEISTELARRGAEVICHSSSEQGSPQLTPKNIAKRARAFENQVYVVSANSAGIAGPGFPQDSTDGHSQVVDYKGALLAEAAFGESMCGFAEIDIEALRRQRGKTAMLNLPARRRVLRGTVS
ncbi:MAG: nitrilase [Gammaproteobacteria bacterium]|nr:nitrilase [Gammaproteobacteria bacterium]